jgi:hypothetical protein
MKFINLLMTKSWMRKYMRESILSRDHSKDNPSVATRFRLGLLGFREGEDLNEIVM